MPTVKQWLYDKVKKKAAARERLTKEITERRHNVEAFVLSILEELDTNIAMTANTSLFNDASFVHHYTGSVEGRIKTLDSGATVSVSWDQKTGSDELPRVNGILISWSRDYQVANDCEPQLYVDILALLLKD